jgi:hypothetical protein
MDRRFLILILVCVLAACSAPGATISPGSIEQDVRAGATEQEVETDMTLPAAVPTASQPTHTEEVDTDSPVTLPLGETSKPEEISEIARQHLADTLGVPIRQITISQTGAAEWPDVTLGCATKSQKGLGRQSSRPVPGFRYLLVADDDLYEYHSGGGWLVFCGRSKTSFGDGIPLPTGTVGIP